MFEVGHRSASAVLGFGLSFVVLAGHALAGSANRDDGKWHVGMTAVFSGFLCKGPVDAARGLVAALDFTGDSTLAESQKIEESLHCFFSDGPVKFLGRIENSKVFVDPAKGRFFFVAFDIGGGVTAYSWIGEGYVADQPAEVRGTSTA